MSDRAIVAIAISAAVIVFVVSIAVIVIVQTVCKTRMSLVRHTNETEKAIAEAFAGLNENYIMEPSHLSAKGEGKGKQISYINKKDEKHNIVNMIACIIDHLWHSKNDK